jgi:hypothetical protein
MGPTAAGHRNYSSRQSSVSALILEVPRKASGYLCRLEARPCLPSRTLVPVVLRGPAREFSDGPDNRTAAGNDAQPASAS